MKTLRFISLHFTIGVFICVISSINDYAFVNGVEKTIIQLLITLISINFVLCTCTSNALLKYKEQNKTVDLSSVIKELKESIISQVVGLIVVMSVLLIESFIPIGHFCILIFILKSLAIAVLSMYVGLIIDIALTFFCIINNV